MKDGIRSYKSKRGVVSYQTKVSMLDGKTGKYRSTWQTYPTRKAAEVARDQRRTERRQHREAEDADPEGGPPIAEE